MLVIILSLAFAQPLPNEVSASRTCDIISEFYQREEKRLEEKNREMHKECEITRNKLPKKFQKNVQCMQYYIDDSYEFVNTRRFHIECSKILSQINVRKHLYGPMRVEDYERMPVVPDWSR